MQLSVHFYPNIGGVETHLDDLCKVLIKKGFNIFVLTYRPLQVRTPWQIFEKKKNLEIVRVPWIPSLFYKLVRHPMLEFLYLAPGLFLVTPFLLLSKKIDVVHAHGIIAGFAAVFWGRMFGKKVIISLHSIYHFPKTGIYRNSVRWIFSSAQSVLGLSKQSVEEIKSLGIPADKVEKFTYWIDLEKFKAKKKRGKENKFVVLFVGRLVEEKGVKVLLKAAEMWDKNIGLRIVGSGPLEGDVKKAAAGNKKVEFTGPLKQDKLPPIYSGSDILVVPSTSEEGFGRVILEALACGTPVIGAGRGAIIEAMDQSVGELIDISPDSIKFAVESLYKNRSRLDRLAGNCRSFAERRFSEKNADTIIKAYKN